VSLSRQLGDDAAGIMSWNRRSGLVNTVILQVKEFNKKTISDPQLYHRVGSVLKKVAAKRQEEAMQASSVAPPSPPVAAATATPALHPLSTLPIPILTSSALAQARVFSQTPPVPKNVSWSPLPTGNLNPTDTAPQGPDTTPPKSTAPPVALSLPKRAQAPAFSQMPPIPQNVSRAPLPTGNQNPTETAPQGPDTTLPMPTALSVAPSLPLRPYTVEPLAASATAPLSSAPPVKTPVPPKRKADEVEDDSGEEQTPEPVAALPVSKKAKGAGNGKKENAAEHDGAPEKGKGSGTRKAKGKGKAPAKDKTDDQEEVPKGKGKGKGKAPAKDETDNEEEVPKKGKGGSKKKGKGKGKAPAKDETDDEDEASKKGKGSGKGKARAKDDGSDDDASDNSDEDEDEGMPKKSTRRVVVPSGENYEEPCGHCRSRDLLCPKPVNGGSCIPCKVSKVKCTYRMDKAAMSKKFTKVKLAPIPRHIKSASAAATTKTTMGAGPSTSTSTAHIRYVEVGDDDDATAPPPATTAPPPSATEPSTRPRTGRPVAATARQLEGIEARMVRMERGIEQIERLLQSIAMFIDLPGASAPTDALSSLGAPFDVDNSGPPSIVNNSAAPVVETPVPFHASTPTSPPINSTGTLATWGGGADVFGVLTTTTPAINSTGTSVAVPAEINPAEDTSTTDSMAATCAVDSAEAVGTTSMDTTTPAATSTPAVHGAASIGTPSMVTATATTSTDVPPSTATVNVAAAASTEPSATASPSSAEDTLGTMESNGAGDAATAGPIAHTPVLEVIPPTPTGSQDSQAAPPAPPQELLAPPGPRRSSRSRSTSPNVSPGPARPKKRKAADAKSGDLKRTREG
jgi:hypothetical protein